MGESDSNRGQLAGAVANTAIGRKHMADAEKVSALLKIADNPLTILEMRFRPAVLEFWTMWGHFLKDHLLTLSKRVAVLIQDERLNPEDLSRIFGAINAKARAKPILFAPELFGRIDSETLEYVRIRNNNERQARERSQASNFRTVATNLAERFRSGRS